MDVWVKIAAIVGGFAVVALPIFKSIYTSLLSRLLTQINYIRKDILIVQRDQSRLEIEVRRVWMLNNALSHFIKESLADRDVSKAINKRYREIDEQVNDALIGAEADYKLKLEKQIEDDKKNGGERK